MYFLHIFNVEGLIVKDAGLREPAYLTGIAVR
jgi:hypothetical protein